MSGRAITTRRRRRRIIMSIRGKEEEEEEQKKKKKKKKKKTGLRKAPPWAPGGERDIQRCVQQSAACGIYIFYTRDHAYAPSTSLLSHLLLRPRTVPHGKNGTRNTGTKGHKRSLFISDSWRQQGKEPGTGDGRRQIIGSLTP
jgi:hypothetical protein